MSFLPSVRTAIDRAVGPATTSTPTPISTFPTLVRVNQVENIDGPNHKFQVSEELLYEREFQGETYVSAHLQRMQHGVFADENIHAKSPLHVTFVAVSFVFHAAISLSHRFQSALIEITAHSEDGGPLRFVKFAPHLAYGRMSSELLKWTFQLGASLGVTQGPVNLAVNPSGSYERDKVLGTMMKIQGSTRSHHKTSGQGTRKRIPDTKLVWSLEENSQQETGLPREFTFVFLIARPTKTQTEQKTPTNSINRTRTDLRTIDENGEHAAEKAIVTKQVPEPKVTQISLDHDNTFKPMSLRILVKPRISNTMTGPLIEEWEETKVSGEVGQKLPVAHTATSIWRDPVTSGLYNFAKMPGNFEDLIELPGNTVTTVEPNLPVGSGAVAGAAA